MKNNSIKKQLNLLMGENYFKNISHFSSKKIPKIDIRKKIIDSLKKIGEFKLGIALVYNKKKLIGLISDGDIRRHLIKGGSLNEELKKILNKSMISLGNFSMINCIRKMKKMKSVSAIPIIDSNKNCIAIYNGSTQ